MCLSLQGNLPAGDSGNIHFPQVTGAGSYRKLRDNVSYVLTPGNLPAGDSETPILAVSPNANSLKRA